MLIVLVNDSRMKNSFKTNIRYSFDQALLYFVLQASYFSSMFSGSWKESQDSVIFMDIPDENIDVEGKHNAVKSQYDKYLMCIFIRNSIYTLYGAQSKTPLNDK